MAAAPDATNLPVSDWPPRQAHLDPVIQSPPPAPDKKPENKGFLHRINRFLLVIGEIGVGLEENIDDASWFAKLLPSDELCLFRAINSAILDQIRAFLTGHVVDGRFDPESRARVPN